MHYDIDYSAIENADEKRAKAVADITEFIGEKAIAKIADYVKDCEESDPISLDEFKIAVSFAGVTGYPVIALYEQLTGRTE